MGRLCKNTSWSDDMPTKFATHSSASSLILERNRIRFRRQTPGSDQTFCQDGWSRFKILMKPNFL